MSNIEPLKDQVLKAADGSLFRPIAEIKGQSPQFVAYTRNAKIMVFNGKLVDDWLIHKYGLTHYLIPKLPISYGAI